MRLDGGTLWPAPVTLDIPVAFAHASRVGETLALREPEGLMLAALQVGEIWESDGKFYVAGKLEGVRPPVHHDFRALRTSPRDMRLDFERLGWRRVVVYQSAQPMTRAIFEETVEVAKTLDAGLLLQVLAGPDEGQMDAFALIRSYQAMLPRYRRNSVKLAVLPLARRTDPLRDTILRAIVARNYGCSHILMPPEEAELLRNYAADLGIEAIAMRSSVSKLPPDRQKEEMFPEVAREVERSFPPRERQGVTIFFTGLSGAGKSTIANILRVKLLERGGRQVTLLDGDLVRKNLSSELGFSPEHRDVNIRRIGYVASEITKNGGIAICAPIAPYRRVRREVREMIAPRGSFILVYLATPIETCEGRDVKGLYAKARAGLIGNFTGVSDPYEAPEDAEITINTSELSAEESAERILQYLQTEGYLAGENKV